jgi:PKD repeat protein
LETEYDQGFFWDTGPPYVVITTTGAMNDHTTGGGKYLVSDIVNFVPRDSAYILSPRIDLSTLTNPEMTFWYHMYGSGIAALYVQIDTGNGWYNLDSIIGQQQSSKTQAWLERTIDLSDYQDDTVQFKFYSVRTPYSSASEIDIDDLSIHEQPLCTKPTSIAVNHEGITNATLSWTGGGAGSWLVKYKAVTDTAFTFLGATNNSAFQLTGLIPGTLYEFWVTDSCGAGNIGLWVGPKLFKTLCAPVVTPYFESFDGSAWQTATIPASMGIGKIDGCWSVSDSTYLSWMPYNTNATSSISGPNGPRNGTGNFILFNVIQSGIPVLTSEFISPPIVVVNLTWPELNFWYHMFGNQIGKLEVYVEKLDGTRTNIHTIQGQQQNSKTAPWLLKSIPLTAFSNDTIRIVFEGHKSTGTAYASSIAIDDVEIVDGFCHAPTNLSATSNQPNTAVLTWQSTNLRSNIEWGPAGFTLGQGNVISNVTSPHTIAGLQASTNYDFYVQDSCRSNNSTWTGPQAFTSYCDTPTAAFSYVNQVSFITFDASTSQGPIANYDWDFGDGTTGTGISPNHTYATASIYSVRLVVTDVCGLTDTIYSSVSVCPPPQAIINYTISGLTVSFDATQSMNAVSYWWDFGSRGTTNLPQPTVVFFSKAIYPVYLIVTDSCGGKDTAFLELNLCDKPEAIFTYTILGSGGGGMTVQFDGSLSQNALSFEWDFGDGNTNNTSLTPIHVYSVPSLSYEVSLIIYADCGLSDTLSYKLQDVVAVDEDALKGLRIYPNPTTDRLFVELPPKMDDIELIWYDAAGKQLLVPIINSAENRMIFDLTHVAAGSYTLVVKSNGHQRAIKVIVD